MGANVVAALAEVQERIKSSPEVVKAKLIARLADREIDSRVELMDKALVKLDDLRKEVYKAKADQVTFNEDGTKTAETYSKAALDARNKAKEELDKWEQMIEKALVEGDFSKLKEKVK